jgi:two-component system, OmpR family, alkaline phosphatase synthesis response regulator PhoP
MNLKSNLHRRILIVEDEAGLRRTLTDFLSSQGYIVQSSADGNEGQTLASTNPFDLIILDVMLPSRNGFDICRNLRNDGIAVPILMLTARSELNNKVLGLNAGADDYLTKPFEVPELKARIEALLRRASGAAPAELKSFDFAGIHVDFVRSKLAKGGKTIPLSEREARLLRYLIERKGVVLSRNELLENVWGYNEAPLTRTVDVHIVALRQKLEDDPRRPQFIITVHGEGYRFAG